MIRTTILAAAVALSLASPVQAFDAPLTYLNEDSKIDYFALQDFGERSCRDFKLNMNEAIEFETHYPFHARGDKRGQFLIDLGIRKERDWEGDVRFRGVDPASICARVWNALGPNGTMHPNVFTLK